MSDGKVSRFNALFAEYEVAASAWFVQEEEGDSARIRARCEAEYLKKRAALMAFVAELQERIDYFDKCTIIPPPLTAEEFDRMFPDGFRLETILSAPRAG